MPSILDDPDGLVPEADRDRPGAFGGFRAACSRFANGEAHEERRAFIEQRLAQVDADELRATAAALSTKTPEFLPTAALARALGFDDPDQMPDVVAVIATAYQTGDGDDETDRATELALAKAPVTEPELHLQMLVQGYASTARLARGEHPPVPTTRRVVDGHDVVVPLDDAWFGSGPRRCPGQWVAELLADQVER